jgi:hypothetical protein
LATQVTNTVGVFQAAAATAKAAAETELVNNLLAGGGVNGARFDPAAVISTAGIVVQDPVLVGKITNTATLANSTGTSIAAQNELRALRIQAIHGAMATGQTSAAKILSSCTAL